MDVKLKFVQKFYDTLYEDTIPEINLSDPDCDALIPLFEDILEGSLSYGSGFRSKSLNKSEESGANESNELKEETLENGVSAVEPVKELLEAMDDPGVSAVEPVKELLEAMNPPGVSAIEPVKELLEAMNPPGVSAIEPVKELLDAMHPPGVSAVEPVKELLDGMNPGPESVPELGPSSSASASASSVPSASASSGLSASASSVPSASASSGLSASASSGLSASASSVPSASASSVPSLVPSASASSGLSVGPSASASSNANQPIIQTIIPIIDTLFDSFKEEYKSESDDESDDERVKEAQVATLSDELASAKEALALSKNELALAKESKETSEQTVQKLQQDIEIAEKSEYVALEEQKKLKAELEEAQAELTKAQAEQKATLELAVGIKEALETAQQDHQEEIKKAQNKFAEAKLLAEETIRKRAEAEEKVKVLERNVKRLKEEIDLHKLNTQSIRRNLEKEKQQFETMKDLFAKAKDTVEKMQISAANNERRLNELLAKAEKNRHDEIGQVQTLAIEKSNLETKLAEAIAAAEAAQAETAEANLAAERQRKAAEEEREAAAEAKAEIARLTEENLQAQQKREEAIEARLAAEQQAIAAAEEKARAATGQAEQQRAAAEALKNAQSREEAAIETSRVKEAALEKSMEERITDIANEAERKVGEATRMITSKLDVEKQNSVALEKRLAEVSAALEKRLAEVSAALKQSQTNKELLEAALKQSQTNKELLEAAAQFQRLKAAAATKAAIKAAQSFVEDPNEEHSEEESKEEDSEESKEGTDPAYSQLKEELDRTKEELEKSKKKSIALEQNLQEAKNRSNGNQLELQSLGSTLGNVTELKTKLEKAEAEAENQRAAAAAAVEEAAAAAAEAQAQAESNAKSLQIELDKAKAQAAAAVAAKEAQAQAEAKAQVAEARAHAADQAQALAEARAQEAEAKAQAAEQSQAEALTLAQASEKQKKILQEQFQKEAKVRIQNVADANKKTQRAEYQAKELQERLLQAEEELKKLKTAAEDKAKEAQATLKSDIKTILEMAETRAGIEQVELNHEETTEIKEAMEEASRQAKDKVFQQIKDFNRHGHHINMRAGKVSLALRRLHRLNAREKPAISAQVSAISAQVSLPKPILDEFLNEPQIQCIDSNVNPITPINIKENDVPILNPPEREEETPETPEILIGKLVQTLETQMSIDQTSVHEKLFSCLEPSNQGEPSNQSCESKLESANLMVKNGSDALILADLKEARDELKDDDKTREILAREQVARESGVDKMVEVKTYKYTATNEAADQSNAYTRATIAWIDTGMEWLYAYSKCKKNDLLYNSNIAFGNAIKLYNSATQLLDLAFRYSTRQFRLSEENKLLNYQATKTQKEAMTASMNLTFAKNRLDAISNDMSIDIYNIDEIFIESSHVKDIDELYQYIWSNKLYQHTFFTPSKEVNRINVYYKEATSALADANQTLNQGKIHCQSIGHPINLDSKFDVSLDDSLHQLKDKKISLKKLLMTRYQKELAAAKLKANQGSIKSIETEISEQITELNLDDDSGVFSESNLSKQLNELYSRKPIKEGVPDETSNVSDTNNESNVESNGESTNQEKWMKYARKQTNGFNFQSKHPVNGSEEASVLAEKPPSEAQVLSEERNVNPVIEKLNNLSSTLHRDYPSRVYTIKALINEKIKLLRLNTPNPMERSFNAKVDKLKLKPDLSNLLKSV